MRSLTFTMVVAVSAPGSFGASGNAILLQGLFRFRIVESTTIQARELAAQTDPETSDQILGAVDDWRAAMLKTIRTKLAQQFGSDARNVFGQFIEDFTQAEIQADMAYLDELAASAGIAPRPRDYAALTQQVLQGDLRSEMQSAAAFLS